MDDLRVENYDAKEVESKKRSILKRVAMVMAVTGGAAVIGLVLGLFGLILVAGMMFGGGSVGGSGSWFFSTLESA